MTEEEDLFVSNTYMKVKFLQQILNYLRISGTKNLIGSKMKVCSICL